MALGKLALAKNSHSEALALLEKARSGGEDSATLYSELGRAYTELRQWEKAALAYERALKHQRRNTQWRLALARALKNSGKTKEAEVKYREVLALNPNESEAWKGLKNLGERY